MIVQTGSALGRRGVPLQSAYCGAKHAVKGFTEALQTELKAAGSGVLVTRVDLPGVNTPQFDWVLNKIPKRPQPVAPIYAPEFMRHGDGAGRRAPAAARLVDRPPDRLHRAGQRGVAAVHGLVPRPQRGVRPAHRRTDARPTTRRTCGSRRTAPTAGTSAPRGGSATSTWTRDPQIWAGRHHGVLAAVGAAGLAGLAVLRRRR